jgi:uncharacterized damage-inducible protein DinB
MSRPEHRSPSTLPEATFLRLKSQLDSLDAILAGASEDALLRRPADGSWSARDHLAHLARYHELFLERLDRILTEDGVQLTRYRTEDDPAAAPWFRLPVADLLARLRALRAEIVQRVAGLTASQWRHTGVHPAFGAMPLTLWIEFFLVHEGHHLYAILQRVRRGSP